MINFLIGLAIGFIGGMVIGIIAYRYGRMTMFIEVTDIIGPRIKKAPEGAESDRGSGRISPACVTELASTQ